MGKRSNLEERGGASRDQFSDRVNPKPQIPNPWPSLDAFILRTDVISPIKILSSRPSTLNPQPSTLNPSSQADQGRASRAPMRGEGRADPRAPQKGAYDEQGPTRSDRADRGGSDQWEASRDPWPDWGKP